MRIKVDKIQKVVEEHVRRDIHWLSPITMELEITSAQEEVNKGKFKQGYADFKRAVLAGQIEASKDLKAEMMNLADKLDRNDMPSEVEFCNTIIGDFRWITEPGNKLWFHISLKPKFYAAWFDIDTNPFAFAYLISAVRDYLRTGSKDGWEKKLEVPEHITQVRLAHETYCTGFQLKELGKQVCEFPYYHNTWNSRLVKASHGSGYHARRKYSNRYRC